MKSAQITKLVAATGPSDESGRSYGFTFSDLSTRMLPAAVLEAFPDHRSRSTRS